MRLGLHFSQWREKLKFGRCLLSSTSPAVTKLETTQTRLLPHKLRWVPPCWKVPPSKTFSTLALPVIRLGLHREYLLSNPSYINWLSDAYSFAPKAQIKYHSRLTSIWNLLKFKYWASFSIMIDWGMEVRRILLILANFSNLEMIQILSSTLTNLIAVIIFQ
jgi:hypothetical protein